jgi:hypothetical protein
MKCVIPTELVIQGDRARRDYPFSYPSPRDIIESVFKEVEAFCGNGFDDDVTMLAVRRRH